ncbi:hypothetical protein [Flammeovirga sp. OC4]|uniref:hypothetical protein n=1 Tax=Flammeovirga sp. OC4 TaxID=1382345 RepID=UPI0005C5E497|nr:hypothetical protein [Flammeovirga sp. OC4]
MQKHTFSDKEIQVLNDYFVHGVDKYSRMLTQVCTDIKSFKKGVLTIELSSSKENFQADLTLALKRVRKVLEFNPTFNLNIKSCQVHFLKSTWLSGDGITTPLEFEYTLISTVTINL